jgi:hypothetical protein
MGFMNFKMTSIFLLCFSGLNVFAEQTLDVATHTYSEIAQRLINEKDREKAQQELSSFDKETRAELHKCFESKFHAWIAEHGMPHMVELRSSLSAIKSGLTSVSAATLLVIFWKKDLLSYPLLGYLGKPDFPTMLYFMMTEKFLLLLSSAYLGVLSIESAQYAQKLNNELKQFERIKALAEFSN